MAFTLKKIVNNISNPIRLGVFTFQSQARFDVDAGSTLDTNLQFESGHPVVVVWDALGNAPHPFVVSAQIDMEGNTGLSIHPHSIDPFTPVP
jgi:hypothetical protein